MVDVDKVEVLIQPTIVKLVSKVITYGLTAIAVLNWLPADWDKTWVVGASITVGTALSFALAKGVDWFYHKYRKDSPAIKTLVMNVS